MSPPGSHVADNLTARSPRSPIVAGLVGALIAAVVTVIAMNFVTGEKPVQRKLELGYAIDDRRPVPSRVRHPAGTAIDGNRVTNLENGIEIFRAMLQAA